MKSCIVSDYFGTRAEYGLGSSNPVYTDLLDGCEGAGYLDNDKLEEVVLAATGGGDARPCPSDYVYCESRCLSCSSCDDDLQLEFNGWCKRRLEKWATLYRNTVQTCAMGLCSAPCDWDRWDYIFTLGGMFAALNVVLIITSIFKRKPRPKMPKVQSAIDAYETYRDRHDLDTEEDINDWNQKMGGSVPDFYHATQIATDLAVVDEEAVYEDHGRNEMAIVEDFRSGGLEVCYPVNAPSVDETNRPDYHEPDPHGMLLPCKRITCQECGKWRFVPQSGWKYKLMMQCKADDELMFCDMFGFDCSEPEHPYARMVMGDGKLREMYPAFSEDNSSRDTAGKIRNHGLRARPVDADPELLKKVMFGRPPVVDED